MNNILIGDCIESMRGLPDQSVQTCVTSPPYFGLRDYGHDGQIGLEPTPDSYVAKMVEVFREVRRVLADDGTLWLNLGDSYASYRDGKATPDTTRGDDVGTLVEKGQAKNRMASTFAGTSIKHKDIIGIPWRVAFALQADGWYLRQDIIWHKPNPMPESVRDRCTKAHEYIFLMAKSEKYFFDSEAIKEAASQPLGKAKLTGQHKADAGGFTTNGKGKSTLGSNQGAATRNRRSVWTIATRPYSGAHFATFPPDLIEPCILAGSRVGDIVLDPFGGSGTTGMVAQRNQRKFVLCELNPEYARMAEDRIANAPKKTLALPFGDA